MKPVTNKTDDAIELGGVEIAPASQQTIRTALITEDEKQTIIEDGGVIHFGADVVTVSQAKTNDETKVKDEAGNNSETNDETKVKDEANSDSGEVKHLAYPKSLITAKGFVSGQKKHKSIVESLDNTYSNLLNDNDFAATYPNADIEAFRVEEV